MRLPAGSVIQANPAEVVVFPVEIDFDSRFLQVFAQRVEIVEPAVNYEAGFARTQIFRRLWKMHRAVKALGPGSERFALDAEMLFMAVIGLWRTL